jgi:transcriptional regulator with XRE-family HTH domain
MSKNEALYLLRKDKGMSLKEASKGSHVPLLLLYLYEQGYLRPSKKSLTKLASFYSVEVTYFEEGDNYPKPIFPDNGNSKFMSALYKYGATWKAFAVSAALFAVSLSLTISGSLIVLKTNTKTESYFGEDYVSLANEVIAKGEDVLIEQVKQIDYAPDENNDLSLTLTTTKNAFGDLIYLATVQSGTSTYSFKFAEASSDLSVEFARSEDSKDLFSGTAKVEENAYTITTLIDSDKATPEQSVWDTEQTSINQCPTLVNNLFEGMKTDQSLTTKASLYNLLLEQGKGNEKLNSDTHLGDNLLLLPSLFGAMFFCLCALMVWGIIHKKRHPDTVPVAIAESPEEALEPVLPSQKRPTVYRDLNPNWRLTPPLPETVLRLVAIGIVLASSIMLFRLCYVVLIKNDFLAAVGLISDAKTWYQFMPLVSMATLLWFFIRLEIMPSEHYNLLPAIIMFFFGGCVYYVAENVLAFYLTDTGSYYYNLLFVGLTYILPGNLFWGIGCFALIDLFLLTTPDFLKSKKQKVIWRSLAALPVLYLILSYLYQVGTSLWSWPEWPSYLASLLYRKQFPTMIFSIFFPFSVYLYRRLVVYVYGEEKAVTYFHGNKYFFIKNFIAAFWIALIVLVNFAMANTDYAKALGLTSKSYWMALLIPVVLLYHPHMGKRNSLFDNIMTFLYIGSMSFAYIYLAYYLLFVFPRMFNLV